MTADLLILCASLRNAGRRGDAVRLAQLDRGTRQGGAANVAKSTLAVLGADGWTGPSFRFLSGRALLLSRIAAIVIVSLGSSTARASAQAAPAQPGAAGTSSNAARIGSAQPADGPCVIVEIEGHRAGHLECAAARLEESARLARTQAEAGRNVPVAGTGSPDVQIGVSSLSASRLRMGRNLGVSARPDRPSMGPVNPLGRRP